MTAPRDMDIEIGVISDNPERVLQVLEGARKENIRRIESLERENDELLDMIELVSDLIAKRAERNSETPRARVIAVNLPEPGEDLEAEVRGVPPEPPPAARRAVDPDDLPF